MAASPLSATTLKPCLANSGIMSAWADARRWFGSLTIHLISGTTPSFSQKPSAFFVQPSPSSSVAAAAGSKLFSNWVLSHHGPMFGTQRPQFSSGAPGKIGS